MDAGTVGASASLGVIGGFSASYLASMKGLETSKVIALAVIAVTAAIGIVVLAMA